MYLACWKTHARQNFLGALTCAATEKQEMLPVALTTDDLVRTRSTGSIIIRCKNQQPWQRPETNRSVTPSPIGIRGRPVPYGGRSKLKNEWARVFVTFLLVFLLKPVSLHWLSSTADARAACRSEPRKVRRTICHGDDQQDSD